MKHRLAVIPQRPRPWPSHLILKTSPGNQGSAFYAKKENQVVDFKYQPLLPYQLSCQGPQLSKGDVNGDGLEDVFIGGPRGEASALFLQTAAGAFTKSPSQPWVKDSLCRNHRLLFL